MHMYTRGRRRRCPFDVIVYWGIINICIDIRSTAGTSVYDYIGEERRGTSIVDPTGRGGPVPERSLPLPRVASGKDAPSLSASPPPCLHWLASASPPSSSSFPAYMGGTGRRRGSDGRRRLAGVVVPPRSRTRIVSKGNASLYAVHI